MNRQLSRFYSTVAIQKQGQEIIDVLCVSFMECLLNYYKTNSKWPANIVIFRDGVGDGQIDSIETHEANQFLSTFAKVSFKVFGFVCPAISSLL